MSLEDFAVYLVPEDSTAYRQCDQFLEEYNAATKLNKQFAVSLGATDALIGAKVLAFAFPEGHVPDGFRLSSKHFIGSDRAYEPAATSKAGKQLRARIEELPEIPGYNRFDRLIGGRELMCKNLRILHAGFDMVAGKRIIFVPLKNETDPFFEPEGCTRLKLSEFYAMKEAVLAEKGGAS